MYHLRLSSHRRKNSDSKLYNVEISDWVMADGACATATIIASDVRRAYSSSSQQLMRVVLRAKKRGDAAFKSGDMPGAILQYDASVKATRDWSSRQARTDKQMESIGPVMARVLGNLALVHLRTGAHASAHSAAHEAIQALSMAHCPQEDMEKMLPKFLFRRGKANHAMGVLQAALDDFSHPAVVGSGHAEAARLAMAIKAQLAKKKKK